MMLHVTLRSRDGARVSSALLPTGITRENLAHRGPILLNRWKRKDLPQYQPLTLSKNEQLELLNTIVTPDEHVLADAILHHYFEYEPLGLTRGQEDAWRVTNALNQLADITHFRLLGKTENLPFGFTFTSLGERAYSHYFNKTEAVSTFFKRRLKLKLELIPHQTGPFRPQDRALTNVFLSRILLTQAFHS